MIFGFSKNVVYCIDEQLYHNRKYTALFAKYYRHICWVDDSSKQARSTLHYYVFEKVGNGEMPPLGFIYMSSNKVTTSPLPPFLIALMLKRHTVSET